MRHVVHTQELPWKPFEAETLRGYALKPQVIGREYTDAYSADLVRIEAGGESLPHVDVGRHAFYILQGRGVFELGEERFALRPGCIVKVPPGVPHALRADRDQALVLLTLYDPPRHRG